MQSISTFLDSGWELAERRAAEDLLPPYNEPEKLWLPATVPGHVHTDLVRAGVISDPFGRLAEWGARWVDESNWTYRTSFFVDAERLAARGTDGKHFLHFHGLDTLARVFLNGRYLGQADNYHRAWRFDVSEQLREGENELRVEFDSALRAGQERAKAYIGEGKSDRGTTTYFNFPPRAFVRKPQYMFGWDWGPELVSCGIHGPVELLTVAVAEILHWKLDYKFISNSVVDIDFAITLRKYDSQPLTVKAVIFASGDTTPSTVLEGPAGEYTVPLHIRSFVTERWNPHGVEGPRKRHLLNLRLLSISDDPHEEPEPIHRIAASIGFRELELVREKDAAGESFLFKVNGQPLFIKGANWIPDHSLPTTITKSRLRQRLTAARDAGFNMLRVWGGGLYESQDFYSLCDELGILVWQDFAFACATYPDDDPLFVESVRAEAIANIRRLRHHPSLALWCGGNENVELHQGRWSGAAQATKFYGERLILETLPGVLEHENPQVPYWPNSPYGGTDCRDETMGDSHYWNVWHSKEPGSNGDWTNYEKCDTRFSSEFGFAAPAGLTTWQRSLAPDELSVRSLASRWHDKTRKGYETYLGFIQMHFPEPQCFSDLVYYGQCNQALAFSFGIEHWRRRKGHCWGTLFWQLNDCWPTHSWSVIDSGGEPKLAYYAIKRAYAPILLSLRRVGRVIESHLVNDTLVPLTGQLRLDLLTFEGEAVSMAEQRVTVSANAASGALLTLPIPSFIADAGSDVFVHATFTPESGLAAESFLLLAEPKDLRLADPGLQTHVAAHAITVQAKRFAAFVTLHFEGVSVQPKLSDNGFFLAPGQARTIAVSELPDRLSLAQLAPRLRLRSL
ncbi:glycoside hydrolase family 2 protein [Armatimonas rosea]|uniref:beta-mannosidase n=1 Tax=Armatimonas rosea TaxID=685828 RepID=A0A7W9SX40_ARMRO|nr:glycoside hydrolase family 2 protein [Armatimonas rosea]MBB6053995.1 beta-mannosidase [Armatimonas rosea]